LTGPRWSDVVWSGVRCGSWWIRGAGSVDVIGGWTAGLLLLLLLLLLPLFVQKCLIQRQGDVRSVRSRCIVTPVCLTGLVL
jgi:hypothetical protein